MRWAAMSVAAGLVVGMMSGCGLSFEHEWRAAKNDPVPCDQFAGLWEGTWESDYNGHTGKLRAIITKCDDGRYRAYYHATFAYVIPFAYETTHTATFQDGVTYFTGEEDLGYFAGGYYYYNGQTDGTSFVACYRADKDHGMFRMTRVSTGCGCGCGGQSSCCGSACIQPSQTPTAKTATITPPQPSR